MDFRRLHETLGAEVTGLDLFGDITAGEVAELQAALKAHSLLLFRLGRRMTPDRQIEIARWFGTPTPAEDKEWTVLSNDHPAGSWRLPFHSDFTYTDAPTGHICLHMTEAPRNGTATTFVSGVHAWATLPAELKTRLSAMTVRHVLDSEIMGPDEPVFVADHPVRLDHPGAAGPVLLVTEHHAERINELPPEESRAVLSQLFAHLYDPKNVYVHDWELYDLLLWDNIAIQHARPERSEPEDGPRTLQRVTLGGRPYPEHIERARRQERERAATRASVMTPFR